jgi:hypothetical protein
MPLKVSAHAAPSGKTVVDPEIFTSVAAIEVAIVTAIKETSNVAISFLIVITGRQDYIGNM